MEHHLHLSWAGTLAPTPIELWFTFIASLLASGHCIGMCGGMVTALGFAPGGHSPAGMPTMAVMVRHLVYGLSRVSTYLLIGALSGWLGSLAPFTERSPWLRALPLGLAGLVMIVMGLDTLGVAGFRGWQSPAWFSRLQKGGATGWKPALTLGILTGLLPCGLHWAFQAKAFATGSVTGGLLIIGAFGLGTLPALWGLGWVFIFVGPKIRRMFQVGAALVIVGMGILALVKGFNIVTIKQIP
ncbi:MAG: sulfite exporter TauE/SafE family protein [Magnetococcales bacterium]|nr:sulfite exporter TauE/SafE family protein [Magnetococcales bacterium]MBF0421242.1 sulfite exporter TauE/SafE family protein [Magnetococcales bacterium]